MRFGGENGNDLFVLRHATFHAGHIRQQSVIEPFAPTQSMAVRCESYSRDQYKVQSLQRESWGIRVRLQNAKITRNQIQEGSDLRRSIASLLW